MGIAVPMPCNATDTCAFTVFTAPHIGHQNKATNDCAFSTVLFVERALHMAAESAGNVAFLAECVSEMKTSEHDYGDFRIRCVEKLRLEAAVHETVRLQLSPSREDATAAPAAAPATAVAESGAACIPPEDSELASDARRDVGCNSMAPPDNILVHPARDHCLQAAPHAGTLSHVVEVANAVLQLGDDEKNDGPAAAAAAIHHRSEVQFAAPNEADPGHAHMPQPAATAHCADQVCSAAAHAPHDHNLRSNHG
jgi:hypothetical protein